MLVAEAELELWQTGGLVFLLIQFNDDIFAFLSLLHREAIVPGFCLIFSLGSVAFYHHVSFFTAVVGDVDPEGADAFGWYGKRTSGDVSFFWQFQHDGDCARSVGEGIIRVFQHLMLPSYALYEGL